MRAASLIFFGLSLIALGLDIYVTYGSGVRLRSIAETWFSYDRDSWLLLQPAVERYVHEDLWFGLLEPVFRQSTVFVFGGIGVFSITISMLARWWRRENRAGDA